MDLILKLFVCVGQQDRKGWAISNRLDILYVRWTDHRLLYLYRINIRVVKVTNNYTPKEECVTHQYLHWNRYYGSSFRDSLSFLLKTQPLFGLSEGTNKRIMRTGDNIDWWVITHSRATIPEGWPASKKRVWLHCLVLYCWTLPKNTELYHICFNSWRQSRQCRLNCET